MNKKNFGSKWSHCNRNKLIINDLKKPQFNSHCKTSFGVFGSGDFATLTFDTKETKNKCKIKLLVLEYE